MMKKTTLPETERIEILKTERGLSETLAEIYGDFKDSNIESRQYSLFVFDVGKIYRVQKRNNLRFGESYRFFSVSPKSLKREIEKNSRDRGIELRFSWNWFDIYMAKLQEGSLLNVIEILSDLEKRYS